MEIRNYFKDGWRWAAWLLGAAAIALLTATLETGRLHAQNSSFTFLGALSNVITPNGDGRNDRAVFCFDNPRSSEVSGTVFDLRGNKVSSMSRSALITACPAGVTVDNLTWDGRSDGSTVRSGVYLYQIQSEGTTVTGTVMVVR